MNRSFDDQTNVSAHTYQESVTDDIVELCRPLSEHLGIEMFSYIRVFFDGRCFFITNQLDFSRNYFQFILKEDASLLIDKSVQNLFIPQQILPIFWPAIPTSKTMHFLYNHGFWPGFSFGRKRQDSIEYWTFLGNKEYSTDMHRFYLCNQDVLLKFIHYFNMHAQNIIKCEEGDKYKLSFYKKRHKAEEELVLSTYNPAINSFLKELRKNSIHLCKATPELTHLTNRELDCLALLTKGETAKEIAQNLSISPRTVETYLQSIKHKTGLHCRSQLVKLFLTHFS